MTIPQLSWYLCIVFALGLGISSAVSVTPQTEHWMHWQLGILLGLVLTFATVAMLFQRFRLPQSKWLLRLFQGLAVLATLGALALLGG